MGGLSLAEEEISEISRLLVDLRRADRDRRKMICAKVRRIGFYITDVSYDTEEFTTTDFGAPVRRGVIRCEKDLDGTA